MTFILPVLLVLFVLNVSVKLSVAYEKTLATPSYTSKLMEDGTYQDVAEFDYSAFMNNVTDVLSTENFIVKRTDFNEYTSKFLFGAGMILFCFFAYLEANHKNLIRNKEYGTQRWAKKGEDGKFHAEYCKKQELRQWKKKYWTKVLMHDIAFMLPLSLGIIIFVISFSLKKAGVQFDTQSIVALCLTASCLIVCIFSVINKQSNYHVEKKAEKNRLEEKYKCSERVFTKTEKACLFSPALPNNNTLILGGSGSKKTAGYILCNILEQAQAGDKGSSFVFTDPKGEIIQEVYYFLKLMEYEIKVLNLKEKSKSMRYNPFHYIDEKAEDYE